MQLGDIILGFRFLLNLFNMFLRYLYEFSLVFVLSFGLHHRLPDSLQFIIDSFSSVVVMSLFSIHARL